MKILVFGAAFDPPHNGHMTMALEAVKNGLAEKVILVPCGSHAFNKEMSPAIDRFNMTQMMVRDLNGKVREGFELSDIEIKRKGISYAWETLDQIAISHPEDSIGWLMGSDQLREFDKWQKYEEILAKYPVYVYPRLGYPFEPNYPGVIKIEDVPIVEISSRQVRETYLNGRGIGNMVSDSIAKYIGSNNLWTK